MTNDINKKIEELKKQVARLDKKGRTSDAHKKRVEIARLLLEREGGESAARA